ncbi:MAG: hypothetical protein ACT4NY_34435 [Pseudonocardiales bacterium]
MTDEDEEFLTELYRNLTKQAVPPTSPLYVPLEQLPGQVMGPDAVKLLGRTITMTTPGEAFFLTGLRGSGKTVQLLRLRQDLQRRGFAVVMFSAEDYLNMHEPLNIVDVLLFLVGAISDQAVEYDLIAKGDAATSRGWSRLGQWLTGLTPRMQVTGTDVSAGVSAGVLTTTATLKAELRRDTAFVVQLREFLRGRLSELVEQANGIVADLVAEMRARWTNGEWKGLIVIVDSLDHNRAVDSEKFQQVRRALVNLFDKDYDNLRLADCRTVFTLPMYVPISAAKALRRVTNLRVTNRERKPNADGVAAARQVLLQRAPDGKLDRLLDNGDADRLVLASGGHLRILLGLVMEVVTQAESLPVDAATVTTAIEQVRNGMLPLADDQRAMLRRVADNHELPLATQHGWDVVASLLDQHFVLGYQNGEVWYDVHPLLYNDVASG